MQNHLNHAYMFCYSTNNSREKNNLCKNISESGKFNFVSRSADAKKSFEHSQKYFWTHTKILFTQAVSSRSKVEKMDTHTKINIGFGET